MAVINPRDPEVPWDPPSCAIYTSVPAAVHDFHFEPSAVWYGNTGVTCRVLKSVLIPAATISARYIWVPKICMISYGRSSMLESRPGTDPDYLSRRVLCVHGTVEDVNITIVFSTVPNWIFAEEPSQRLIVISGAVVVESGFGVKLPAGVLEGIRNSPGRSREVAKRIVDIAIGELTGPAR